MKRAMITISLTKEEAIYLTEILWRNKIFCGDSAMNVSLLDELVDLLDVKPWDL